MDMNEMKKLLDEELEVWAPQAGDSLLGTLIEKRKTGKFGSLLYVIKEHTTNKLRGIWGCAVIDKHLKEIPINSQVGVKFLGETTGEKGRTYKNYKVIIEAVDVDEDSGR